MDKIKKSVEIIKKYQTIHGSYYASPNFSQYGFCWFRDGSFIAEGIAEAGDKESAYQFFDWGIKAIGNMMNELEKVLKTPVEELTDKDLLPARYTLDGKFNDDEWGNGQSDGYGTFLWAMEKSGYKPPIDFVKKIISYLEKVWKVPCYDIWEESPEGIHTSTLLSIIAGLKAGEKLCGIKNRHEEILEFIKTKLVKNGRLCKSTINDDVDSSLIWAVYPFEIFTPDDPIIINTIREIEKKLYFNGGVKRYPSDTYFGGGSWILLSCDLGGYYKLSGEIEKADKILNWIDDNFEKNGELTEQVPEFLLKEEMYDTWVKKWGEIASPLLWSHANYIRFTYSSNI